MLNQGNISRHADVWNNCLRIIENIIDPSGAVPWGRVQRAPKDGYTLACLSTTVARPI